MKWNNKEIGDMNAEIEVLKGQNAILKYKVENYELQQRLKIYEDAEKVPEEKTEITDKELLKKFKEIMKTK